MTCQHCVRAVFTALAGVEGIARADVKIGSAEVEHDGSVTSAWRTSETGPARRVYRLTESGEAMLRQWVVALEDTSISLARWLDRYALVTSRGDNGEAAGPGQPAPAG